MINRQGVARRRQWRVVFRLCEPQTHDRLAWVLVCDQSREGARAQVMRRFSDERPDVFMVEVA